MLQERRWEGVAVSTLGRVGAGDSRGDAVYYATWR